jgi:hypothetical protein
MHLPPAGRAHARRLSSTHALMAALVVMLTAAPAAARNSASPTSAGLSKTPDVPKDAAPSASTAAPTGAPASTGSDSSGAAGATKETVLAEESRWLGSNVPKLGRAKVMMVVEAQIGGTDVAVGRARASAPKIDKCVLTIEEVFEGEGVDVVTGGARVRQIVPLAHADPSSDSVQQQQPNASTFGMLSGQPWRVTFVMLDGSVRWDRDVAGRRSSGTDGFFDLVVANKEAGAEIVPHLRAAIAACH